MLLAKRVVRPSVHTSFDFTRKELASNVEAQAPSATNLLADSRE